MCNPLPIGGFKWVDVQDKNRYMKSMTYNKQYNFVFECDIKYPDNLHDLHNDYPLAPQKIVIEDVVEMSPYRESIIKKFNDKYDIKIKNSNVPKLVTSFLPKKNYVIHAILLKYYSQLGLKINITKILTYDEKPWMKKFIEFNINKRI